MRRMLAPLLASLAILCLPTLASAQQYQPAFKPQGGATLSVTVASARVALPTNGPTALIINTGANAAYLKFGNASVTAATTDYLLGPGCSAAYDVNGQADVAAITGSSTTTLSVITGAGIPPLSPSGCAAAATPLPADAATATNQTAVQTPVAPATATATHGVAGGGRYHSTPDTLTDGQEDETQFGAHGEQKSCGTDSTGACNYGNVPVVLAQQYPNGATMITGQSTGTTGAVTGTLAGTGGKTTYICGVDISATGGTAAIGPVTVAGLIGGSFVYQFFSTATGANLGKTFSPCIPASATNTAITAATTADGTATAVDVNMWGFQQ